MDDRAARVGQLKKNALRLAVSSALSLALGLFCWQARAQAASFTVSLGEGQATGAGGVLDILLLFGLLALLPSLLVMMTSFTRIVIVLSFLRNALGTQQSPPNQVLIGIAVFLTLFIMQPVLQEVYTAAYLPYQQGQLDQEQALQQAVVPVKRFMLRQTMEKELQLFLSVSGQAAPPGDDPEALTQLGLQVIVPAFMASELKRAFTIGFYLFIPFLIIDMVVSSTLMSMGMVMLPPTTIALPFKIMMFVLVDGWNLLFSSLIQGFR